VKFLLLLIRSDAEWEALSAEERDYAAIDRWWGDLARTGQVLAGFELAPARRARTVRWTRRKPVVTDGPFAESKESIGGYGILEAPDLDAAVAIASTWPARGHVIEVRPIVDRGAPQH